MTLFLQALRRRELLQGLLALPFLSPLARKAPPAGGGEPDDIVERDGWILKRSDLA